MRYFRPDLPPKFWHGGKEPDTMHVVSAFAFLCFESSSSMVTLASIEEWLSYVEGCGLCFPGQVVQQACLVLENFSDP